MGRSGRFATMRTSVEGQRPRAFAHYVDRSEGGSDLLRRFVVAIPHVFATSICRFVEQGAEV